MNLRPDPRALVTFAKLLKAKGISLQFKMITTKTNHRNTRSLPLSTRYTKYDNLCGTESLSDFGYGHCMLLQVFMLVFDHDKM